MAFNFQTFLTRLGSAVVFALIMLIGFLSNEWAFIALFFIVHILCLFEYTLLVEKITQVSYTKNEKMNLYFIGISLFLLVISLKINPCENNISTLFNQFTYYFLGLFIGSLLMFFFFKKSSKTFYLFTALGYITLSFALLVHLRFQSILLPIIILLFIWMNDSLAYLTGSFLGKRKFAPSISPNKTIEGTLGGILFTIAFAFLWGYYTNWFPLWQWIVLGLISSLIGTIGDLAESKLKRMAQVKDSGKLMPGHGGALDRFDSLIFVSPIVFIFSILFIKCLELKIF